VAGKPADPPAFADDALLTVAEPFAFWAIETEGGEPAFLRHPAVLYARDVRPYFLRKVRILNAAHTALLCRALPRGMRTVREAVLDPDVRGWLEGLLFEEIVPVVRGRVEGAEAFARQTLERFASDVLGEDPDLVIWQVGTNDVMHELDLPAYEHLVRGGIERLKAAGVDVMLLDLQYAPKVLERPLAPRVEGILLHLAEQERVPVFRRFALMRHWLDSEQLDFARMLSPDGLHMNDLSYGCLARHMATAISDKTAPPLLAAAARRQATAAGSCG
jgi:hypothetical protein